MDLGDIAIVWILHLQHQVLTIVQGGLAIQLSRGIAFGLRVDQDCLDRNRVCGVRYWWGEECVRACSPAFQTAQGHAQYSAFEKQ